MTELPPPDVMDRAGRFRRLVLAFVVGAICAGAAYAIMRAVIAPEELDRPIDFVSRNMSARGFMNYFTAVTFALSFAITLAVTTMIAKRKWRRERNVPAAKQIE